MTSAERIQLIVPNQLSARDRWALDEALARIGLPYVYHSETTDRKMAKCGVSFDTQLPVGWCGLELVFSGALDMKRVVRSLGKNGDLFVFSGNGTARCELPVGEFFEFCLGRTEEYTATEFDKHGRIRRSQLVLETPEYCQRFLVEEWTDKACLALEECAARKALRLPKRRFPWPKGKTWALHLSHDIDYIDGRTGISKRYLGWMILWMKYRIGRPDLAARYSRKISRWSKTSKDFQFTVPEVVAMESRYAMTSTFYFLVSSRTRLLGERFTASLYSIKHKHVCEAISVIRQAGSEVGVHGRYPYYLDAEALLEHKLMLQEASEQDVAGIRQHCLRLAVPETWRCQEQAGFLYDATLGWREGIGPRAYTARPFRIWDRDAGEPINLFQLPLLIMDASLSGASVPTHQWLSYTKHLLEDLQRYHGGGGVLVHPRYFDREEFPGIADFWEDLLDYTSLHSGWGASGREIIEQEKALRRELKACPG